MTTNDPVPLCSMPLLETSYQRPLLSLEIHVRSFLNQCVKGKPVTVTTTLDMSVLWKDPFGQRSELSQLRGQGIQLGVQLLHRVEHLRESLHRRNIFELILSSLQ